MKVGSWKLKRLSHLRVRLRSFLPKWNRFVMTAFQMLYGFERDVLPLLLYECGEENRPAIWTEYCPFRKLPFQVADAVPLCLTFPESCSPVALSVASHRL